MRTCIFCGGRANSREHLWPDWILKRLPPTRIKGYLGKSKQLEFGAEFKVRTVCGECNGGWMSNLESANQPLIGRMMEDTSMTLDGPQLWTISAWAVKTSMILDSVSRGIRTPFYATIQRERLKSSWAIPAGTFVWLGRYFGEKPLGAFSLELLMQDTFGIYRGFPATFLIGTLAIQVISFAKMTLGIMSQPNRYRSIGIKPAPGPWDELLIGIWPSPPRVYWPPMFAFDDSGTILDFWTLRDRWKIGKKV